MYNNHNNSQITISVCSGVRLLAKLGLLDDIDCITHHEVIEHLKEIAPKANIIMNKRFVDNGNLLTLAGIFAGIDSSII